MTATSTPGSTSAETGTAAGGETGDRANRSRLDPDELAALEEQREFLLRSLEDLEQEHAAGDLDDADYDALKDDYTARAAEVLRALDEQREAFARGRRPRKRGRLVATGVAVLVVALGAGLLVAQSSGQRKPGDTISGGVTTTPQLAIDQQGVNLCVSEFRSASPVDGLKCLDTILAKNPADAFARTFRGWLLYQAIQGTGQPDLEAQAKADITKASASAPAFPIPHFFLAFIANAQGDTATAKAQLDQFDKLGGSAQGMDTAVQALRDSINGTAGTGGTTAPAAPATPTSAP